MESPEQAGLRDAAGPGAARPRENVTGVRIVAALIDLTLLIILFGVMGAAFGKTTSGGGSFSVNLSGGAFILYLLLSLGYYLVPEALTGRTLGKAIMGLKVVSLDGERYDLAAALIRNVLRIVDGLPLFYLVGFVSVAVTREKQRLGDLAAGTVVVRAY